MGTDLMVLICPPLGSIHTTVLMQCVVHSSAGHRSRALVFSSGAVERPWNRLAPRSGVFTPQARLPESSPRRSGVFTPTPPLSG